MVGVNVIEPYAGLQEERQLTIGVLQPSRHPGVPDQLPHAHLSSLATDIEYPILGAWIKYEDARQTKPPKLAGAKHPDETSRIPCLAIHPPLHHAQTRTQSWCKSEGDALLQRTVADR